MLFLCIALILYLYTVKRKVEWLAWCNEVISD